MNEFFNWHDTWAVVQHNWYWMLLAAAIGAWVGWRTCDTSNRTVN
jgi:hypothetical protein